MIEQQPYFEKMYQVSTLNALLLGYTRKVVSVQELLENGDTGLGTFENVDGEMILVDARSENGLKSQHVELKDILNLNQKSFTFSNIAGTLVCLYYPDYMAGINAAGWHFHFVSEDRSKGGHVFNVIMKKGIAILDKISKIEMQLPWEASFDTYALTSVSQKDVKKVEQEK